MTIIPISTPITDFNPRSRVGSDYATTITIDEGSDFNPRSRVGSDGG